MRIRCQHHQPVKQPGAGEHRSEAPRERPEHQILRPAASPALDSLPGRHPPVVEDLVAGAGGDQFEPAMYPTTWPDGDDLLLVVDLPVPCRQVCCGPGASCTELATRAVVHFADALGMAVWTHDHLTVPWLGSLFVDITQTPIRLCAGGIPVAVGSATLPPAWVGDGGAASCLLGLTAGIQNLEPRRRDLGRCFHTELERGRAAIAEVRVLSMLG